MMTIHELLKTDDYSVYLEDCLTWMASRAEKVLVLRSAEAAQDCRDRGASESHVAASEDAEHDRAVEMVRAALRVLHGRRAMNQRTVELLGENPGRDEFDKLGRAESRVAAYTSAIADVEQAARDAGFDLR
jgi:hypothetical protein